MKAVVLAYNNIGYYGILALKECGFEIQAVFTHSDAQDENTWFESVAELCARLGIKTYAPENINSEENIEIIRNLEPDVIFSFYYRQILKQSILDIPKAGCINLHGSLLPGYRGCAPINWAIINGEKETGVTLHYMLASVDAGDIIAQKKFEISYDDTAKDVNLKVSQAAYDMLIETLPLIREGRAPRISQNITEGSYFRRRTPADGIIDWNKSAESIRNLIRAVTAPYPGAFSFINGRKFLIWSATVVRNPEISATRPGTIVSSSPFIVSCGKDFLRVDEGQFYDSIYRNSDTLVQEKGLEAGKCFDRDITSAAKSKKRVLILGVNGFIGSNLAERLLSSGKYEVYGMDLKLSNLSAVLDNPDFQVAEGDITKECNLVDYYVRNCDVVLPLAAIATPAEYTRNPLKIFNLDFEANLQIVKLCFKYGKRVVFPSSSEVYGMCQDEFFNEKTSNLVTGPISKERWIYSCSKQMLDRIVFAYGESGLKYTIFRPFNLIGPRLDSLENAKTDKCRVITKMIYNLVEGKPITLINGGSQKRSFTYIDDAIECLYRIIENKDGLCDGEIINIGNPDNEYSIKELADMTVESYRRNPLSSNFPEAKVPVTDLGEAYYGSGYQDCEHRKPDVGNALRCCGWKPETEDAVM